jgi:hypothetical protein
MSSRGIHKAGSDMVTSCMLGCLRDNAFTVQEFWERSMPDGDSLSGWFEQNRSMIRRSPHLLQD